MAGPVRYQDVSVGTRIPEQSFQIKLVDEIRYCGAHHDFVGVHWSERVAKSVGMPHVVAHGPLTEAKVLSAVHDWTGDPGAVLEQHARFRRPVLLPDDGVGALFRVGGTVVEKLDSHRVVVELTAVSPDDEELATVRATVQLT